MNDNIWHCSEIKLPMPLLNCECIIYGRDTDNPKLLIMGGNNRFKYQNSQLEFSLYNVMGFEKYNQFVTQMPNVNNQNINENNEISVISEIKETQEKLNKKNTFFFAIKGVWWWIYGRCVIYIYIYIYICVCVCGNPAACFRNNRWDLNSPFFCFFLFALCVILR